MSTVTEVNPRLLALTEAGVSVWLDQIRRSLVEGGELARMVAEECAARRDRQPLDLREGDPRLNRLRRGARAARARAARRDGDLRAARDARCAARGRRAARSAPRRPAAATGSSRSRSRRTSRTTPSGTLAEARAYWQRARPPERDDQDPGHAGGRAGDRAGDLRGDQRQRHAAVRGVGLRGGGRGVHPRARAPAGGGPVRWTSTRSRASSSRASTPRSTASSTELGRADLRARRRSRTRALAYRRFKEIFDGPRWEALRHAGAAVQRPLWASTSTKDPRYPDTMYVEELVGAHTVNTMPLQTLLAVADHGEFPIPPARPPSRIPARSWPRSRRRGSTWTR